MPKPRQTTVSFNEEKNFTNGSNQKFTAETCGGGPGSSGLTAGLALTFFGFSRRGPAAGAAAAANSFADVTLVREFMVNMSSSGQTS
jgi:hypothetical protein